jgi:hypothetical protein
VHKLSNKKTMLAGESMRAGRVSYPHDAPPRQQGRGERCSSPLRRAAAGRAHLFVDFDRFLEIAGGGSKVCHLEQALVGLSGGLLTLVVVGRRLECLHRLRSQARMSGFKRGVCNNRRAAAVPALASRE